MFSYALQLYRSPQFSPSLSLSLFLLLSVYACTVYTMNKQ